jgi:macrodomain Ter protein organizer (MatP/YcbG family)
MKNKTKTISIRLNSEEYIRLSNISNTHNMTNSEYIRSLIDDNQPGINNHAPEIAASLSRLYIRLRELGIGEEVVAKEVDALCRTLSL